MNKICFLHNQMSTGKTRKTPQVFVFEDPEKKYMQAEAKPKFVFHPSHSSPNSLQKRRQQKSPKQVLKVLTLETTTMRFSSSVLYSL